MSTSYQDKIDRMRSRVCDSAGRLEDYLEEISKYSDAAKACRAFIVELSTTLTDMDRGDDSYSPDEIPTACPTYDFVVRTATEYEQMFKAEAAEYQANYNLLEYRMKRLCDKYDLDNPMKEPEEERP